jgi:uncharacterized membrane protein
MIRIMGSLNVEHRAGGGSWAGFLAGASVGAVCMYLLDRKHVAGAAVRSLAFGHEQTPVALPGKPAISIERSMWIEAPIADVFDALTHPRDIPEFMQDVRLTCYEPNRVVAWKAQESSPVAHAGVIYFEEDGPVRTRVHIQFSCKPSSGPAGDLVPEWLGDDPKSRADETLTEMKGAIESRCGPLAEPPLLGYGAAVSCFDLYLSADPESAR